MCTTGSEELTDLVAFAMYLHRLYEIDFHFPVSTDIFLSLQEGSSAASYASKGHQGSRIEDDCPSRRRILPGLFVRTGSASLLLARSCSLPFDDCIERSA